MALRLEVVGKSARSVSVAFYYPVPGPVQEASAADSSREPAGGMATRLSAQEITELRAGTLFELTRSFSTHGFTVAQMQARLEVAWTELQDAALDDYKARYKNLHDAFDGTSWS